MRSGRDGATDSGRDGATESGRDGATDSEFQFLLIIRIASLQNCSAE